MGINIKSVQAYLIGLSLPLASEESFWKISWIEKQIHSMKNFKKTKKMLKKNVTIFSSNLNNIFGLGIFFFLGKKEDFIKN